MRPIPIIVIDPTAYAPAGLTPTFKHIQVDILILEAAPQPFDHHFIQPPALAIHRDADTIGLEHARELEAGELAALIGVEYLWLAVTVYGFFQSFKAKAGVHAVRQTPRQHLAAVTCAL